MFSELLHLAGSSQDLTWYSVLFCLPSLAYLYFYTFPTLITFFISPLPWTTGEVYHL